MIDWITVILGVLPLLMLLMLLRALHLMVKAEEAKNEALRKFIEDLKDIGEKRDG